jgi:hypothetical protein
MSFDPATALFELGKTAIEKIWPDPTKRAQELRKLETLKQKGDLAVLDAHVKLMLGQIEINKEEAKSKSIFVAGWRPGVGWICALSLFYIAIVEPLSRLIATLQGYEGPFPQIDTTITLQVLMGMLGLTVARSFDKMKGTQTDKI